MGRCGVGKGSAGCRDMHTDRNRFRRVLLGKERMASTHELQLDYQYISKDHGQGANSWSSALSPADC